MSIAFFMTATFLLEGFGPTTGTSREEAHRIDKYTNELHRTQ
jgi:hypothetical protein